MSDRADVGPLLERHASATGWRSLARAITLVENTPPWDIEIPPAARLVHVIGITGPPGVGKSTLTGRLVNSFADAGARVGVVAIDPSSPISGGAVLGDRVRMEEYLRREGVYARSLASRGSHGALASSARNVARLLESSGSFDVIIVETVGAGQTEVAIAGLADTVVLVTVPGLGDAVQTIKAGLVEVADFIVVNQADRPGAPETMRHFRLTLGREARVRRTIAIEGEGIDELRAELADVWTELEVSGRLATRRREKEVAEATLIAEEWVRACATSAGSAQARSIREAVSQILEEATTTWRQ